jgi:hypothetical protein
LVIWQLLAGAEFVALRLQVRALLARPQLLIALLQCAALDIQLAADKLRRECLARKRTITLGFLRGDLQGYGGKALWRARCAGSHGKSGGAAVEHAELAAVAAEDFDPADFAVGIRV